MKKTIYPLMVIGCLCLLLSSCATVLGGRITQAQKVKQPGEKRAVRPVWLVLDIVGGVIPLAVDFITTAIYKP